MALTHSGHQFLRQAHLIMSAVDNAKRSLQQSTDEIVGELNIGVTSLVAGYYLADLLSRFQRIYHKVMIRVVEDEREYIEHLLVSGELDVAVLMLSQFRASLGVTYRSIDLFPLSYLVATGASAA